jgi:hypothetical protein
VQACQIYRLEAAVGDAFDLSMFGNRARLPHFSEVYEAAHGSVLSRNNCLLLYRTFALAIGSSMASRIGQSARPHCQKGVRTGYNANNRTSRLYDGNNGAFFALSVLVDGKPRMNKRLVVLAALVAAFFLLAAISRLIMGAGKLAETSATREVPQATAKEGLDVKFVSETSPYMRTER